MSKLIAELTAARQALDLTQGELADKAALSRMAVQKAEAGTTDPRLSTLEVMARAMGMEIMLVPAVLRPELLAFVQSGGRYLGQPVGVSAPRSIVDVLIGRNK